MGGRLAHIPRHGAPRRVRSAEQSRYFDGVDGGVDVIPQTLDGIANAADPLQAFSDACGLSFRVTHLWIGNESVGATELGGSGLDMTNTGVIQAQADSRLGAGNTCLFNGDTDRMRTVDDATLDIGTGSMAAFSVHSYDSFPNDGFYASKYTSLGWAMQNRAPSGRAKGFIRTASAQYVVEVMVNHGTVNAQVDLLRRFTSTGTIYMDTREGAASVAEASVGTAANTGGVSVGQTSAGHFGFRGNWGLLAFVKGSDAELVTPAHRSNLQTWLGF